MKILVVDDSRAMRMLVTRTVRQTGLEADFVEAVDGLDAQEKFSDEIDLVLSDWNMPNASGLEFLQFLRRSGSEVTFVFVTSESTGEMRDLARDNGAQALIAKPYTVNSFAALFSRLDLIDD